MLHDMPLRHLLDDMPLHLLHLLVLLVGNLIKGQRQYWEKAPPPLLRLKLLLFMTFCRVGIMKPRLPGSPFLVILAGSGGESARCRMYTYKAHKQGWRPVLVHTETWKEDAFVEQLKQDATKKGADLIIVDTPALPSECVESSFTELQQLCTAINPHLLVLGMDSSAALHQVKKCFPDVCAIVFTKMDDIVFLGTKNHVKDLEPSNVQPFVRWLLRISILGKELDNVLHNTACARHFTLRVLYRHFENLLRIGRHSSLLYHVLSMIPSLTSLDQGTNESLEEAMRRRIRKALSIMDSMTALELDSSDPKLAPSRVIEIAEASTPCMGTDVIEMLKDYQMVVKLQSMLMTTQPISSFIKDRTTSLLRKQLVKHQIKL